MINVQERHLIVLLPQNEEDLSTEATRRDAYTLIFTARAETFAPIPTVSLSSMILLKKNHQQTRAICKETAEVRGHAGEHPSQQVPQCTLTLIARGLVL